MIGAPLDLATHEKDEKATLLNLGCGRTPLPDWINVDLEQPGHTPDVIMDIDQARLEEWTKHWDEDSVDGAQLIHVLEHLPNHLKVMENLWHVLKPGGLVHVRCPHGASDDAWEDPTHIRPLFPGSFHYYAQPTYWRADYGYRGDFRVVDCLLIVPPSNPLLIGGQAPEPPITSERLRHERNVVVEMAVTMEAVKPIREPKRELMDPINARVAPSQGAWS